MLGETFVWHVRLEAEKSLQEALQQIQQLKNEIDALKQRLEAGSVDSGAVQYSRWEKPLGEATGRSHQEVSCFIGESDDPYERAVSYCINCWNMLELDALAMLRTFGESRYSPSIRNCVKTMGMLATSIYTIDNSQA